MATKWIQEIQSTLWEYIWQAWDTRNKIVHRNDKIVIHQIELRTTEEEVNEVFEKYIKVLTEDVNLLENQGKILKRGIGGQRMWLRSIALAAKNIM